MPLIIALASLITWAISARWTYARIRPYTEPIACPYPDVHNDPVHPSARYHVRSCYHQVPRIETNTMAVIIAVLTGFFGPAAPAAILTGRAVRWIVTAGAREDPRELALRLERLQAENDRLRQEAELPVMPDLDENGRNTALDRLTADLRRYGNLGHDDDDEYAPELEMEPYRG